MARGTKGNQKKLQLWRLLEVKNTVAGMIPPGLRQKLADYRSSNWFSLYDRTRWLLALVIIADRRRCTHPVAFAVLKSLGLLVPSGLRQK